MEKIYEMSIVNEADIEYLDYLFLYAGLEERTYYILRDLENRAINVKNIVIIDCEGEHYPISDENKDLYQKYEESKYNKIEIKSCIVEPSAFIKSLKDNGINLNNQSKVGIDITSMNHPYFFVLIKYLKDWVKVKSVDIFYTEPDAYNITQGLLGEFKSTVGQLSAIPMPSYSSGTPSGKSTLLVIILGFDGPLSRFIYNSILPEKYVVINGFPSFLPKYRDLSILFNELLDKEIFDEMYHASADNPFETYNVLKKIYEKYNNFEIHITAIGTKPMALGTCLFAIDYPKVNVVYPRPEKYSTRNSRGYAKAWWYRVEFN
jgi:hypothetical protein